MIVNRSYWRVMIVVDSLLYYLRKLRRFVMWMSLNKRCTYCGREIDFKDTTIDHMAPLSANGTDRAGNIYSACKGCNNLKGAMNLRAFACATIGKNRLFYFQSGQPIDVARARLWMKLYGLLMAQYHKDKHAPNIHYANARQNLIQRGLIKPQ